MRLVPRDPVLRWALALGAGWVAVLGLFFARAWPESSSSSSSSSRWSLLGSPIALRRGARYRGCLRLPWWMPAGADAVRARAEREGFARVLVVEGRPGGWPDVECEYYVEATWSRDDRTLDRPGVVALAWEEIVE